MSDKTIINRGAVVLAVLLIASALNRDAEFYIGMAALVVLGVPIAFVILREVIGEIRFHLETRENNRPEVLAAVEASLRRPVRASAAPPLEARPVWEVVPRDDAATIELEGPR